MGYIYMFCVALMFSFGGTCAKLISPYFSSWFISFFRFFFGVFFLLLLKVIKKQRFSADLKSQFKASWKWLLLGAAGKCAAYMTENYGLTHGPSYGNIITQPAQAVFITLISVFLFREKLGKKRCGCIILCLVGVLCISWNGRSLSDYLNTSVLLTLLFVFSGVFAGVHVWAQKMVADKMDNIDSNLIMFAMAGVMAFVPVGPQIANGALVGIKPGIPCFLAILAFGFITGIGFYLNGKAVTMIPLYMVPVLQSTMVVFAIIWGVLFFHETLTIYLVAGSILFLIGIITLQRLNNK